MSGLYSPPPATFTWAGPTAAIAAACNAAGIPTIDRGRVGTSRQFKAICSALTQLPGQVAQAAADRIDPGTVPDVRARIAAFRAELAAELDAADRCVAEVETALGLE